MKEFPRTKARLEREEAALQELGVTHSGRGIRLLLIAAFLVTILVVPLLQTWRDWKRSRPGHPSALMGLVEALPHAASVTSHSKSVVSAVSAANRSLKEDLHGFEEGLEKHSFLVRRILPRVQWVLTKFLGLGNEKVFVGRDGWLYYRPDVDYLGGAVFEPREHPELRSGKIGPIPALLRFRDDLALRGIRLILLPVPVKPMIEPEHLAYWSPADGQILQNPSYSLFEKELQGRGIEVMDLTTLFRQQKATTGVLQYLKRDTHWTPDAMEGCAEFLARRLREILPGEFPDTGPGTSRRVTVRGRGDLADMLDLPRSAPIFSLEEVVVRPRRSGDGGHWKADPDSPVLLIGDSFSRIYSAPDLNWGRDAGLAERLSDHLGRDIDVLAINAGGSFSVRQALARLPARLDRKKVLLYEFSMRDLTSGDWKVIPLPSPETPPAPKSSEEDLVVSGTVAEASEVPPAGSTPYRDFVRSLHVHSEEGTFARELLVFVQAVRDKSPTRAASIKPGEKITLHLVPWSRVEERYGAMNRSELQGGAADLPDVYWSTDY